MRMIADVPLGAFLSGGIDSSSVVASMALQYARAGEDFFDRLRRGRLQRASACAAMVAKKYNTEHHEIIVRPDSVDLVSKLVRHFDEPFARFLGNSNLSGIRIRGPAREGGLDRRWR